MNRPTKRPPDRPRTNKRNQRNEQSKHDDKRTATTSNRHQFSAQRCSTIQRCKKEKGTENAVEPKDQGKA